MSLGCRLMAGYRWNLAPKKKLLRGETGSGRSTQFWRFEPNSGPTSGPLFHNALTAKRRTGSAILRYRCSQELSGAATVFAYMPELTVS